MSLGAHDEEISAIMNHNFDDDSGIARYLNGGKTMPNTSKNIASPKNLNEEFKNSQFLKACDSPNISGKGLNSHQKKEIAKSYDKSDLMKARKHKRAIKKASPLNEKHKNEIIKTISNKIRDSYMKNHMQGSYEPK
jgi:hypothetical protein